MSKTFAVIVATVPHYYEYSKAHPGHQPAQIAWFQKLHAEGRLIACGPFLPFNGTGLWVLRAASLEEAWAIVKTSPRYTDGMLSEAARVVEWNVTPELGDHRLI